MTESILQVNGLLTAGCARNVEKALLRLPGVHHASANYLNSTATVHYDEAQASPAQLQAAVADCGGFVLAALRPLSATGHWRAVYVGIVHPGCGQCGVVEERER